MLAALATAIIQAPGWGWLSPRTAGLLALAAGALAALAYLEPRRADPLIQFGLFRSAPFSAAIVAAVCGIAALAGFGFLTTLYLQDVRGMSALRAGLTIGRWPPRWRCARRWPGASSPAAAPGSRPSPQERRSRSAAPPSPG